MTSPLALVLSQGNQADNAALAQAMQAGTPQQPFRATVSPTDVEKAYNDYNNAMMQAYAAQIGQQNAMWGGLAGLGAAGITTLPKLLGGAGAGSAAGAGSTALSAGDTAAVADAMGVSAEDIGAGATWADVLPALLMA